jgi:hypothetical protein
MIKLSANRILNNMGIRTKLSKKLFSQVHDKIVKFSEDINNNEMKVPVDNSVYSIFFSKEDKLKDVANRINLSAENVQKVEFLSIKEESLNDQELNYQDIIKSPFTLRLNGYQTIKYFPSINMVINPHPKFNEKVVIN